MYLHRRALIFFIIMLLCVNQMNFFEFVASAEGQVTQPMNEEPNPAVDNNNPDTPNKPLINVRSYHTKPSDVVPGGNVSLSITFQNPTQVTAKDVKITLGEDGMDFLKTFSPRDRGNVFYINEIKGNQFVQKNIVLDTSRDAINQNYNLTLKIIFYDEKGNQFESTETIGIRVVKVDIDRGRPELVLSDIKINPSVVRNNENIEIKAKLKNVGQKNAFNVQLVINDGNVNSPFSTLLSGNHIPLSSKDLYVNKEMNVSFKVALNQYAVDGINNLTLNLTYNDGHKEFSHSEVIGIPVEKNMDKPNLLISAVNTEPAEVEVGEEFRLRLKIENFGGEEASDIRGVVSSIEVHQGSMFFFR
ncbi:COG1361 S-layer family protein [Caldalkalibacillus mannanilyticus]|uniref:COG1361 S-layer family protein n=1 Tax=Caldalkalibacillus mannanilyticus TaxID=1418 RepID=UPI0004698113|nr:hypothetical protein [Caldalkalibacillus mannanilyticus]